jgi:hypothetical protein
MTLVKYADSFKSIDSAVQVLFRGKLICPHLDGGSCARSEHLTISEAKELAASHAEDEELRSALWVRVLRGARSDIPDIALNWQLLGVWFVVPYLARHAHKVSRTLAVDTADVRAEMIIGALRGIAIADECDDVRHQVVKSALSAGWRVERADRAEMSFGLQEIMDRENLSRSGYVLRDVPQGVMHVREITQGMERRIAGERLGSVLHGMGILDEYLDGGRLLQRSSRSVDRGQDVP